MVAGYGTSAISEPAHCCVTPSAMMFMALVPWGASLSRLTIIWPPDVVHVRDEQSAEATDSRLRPTKRRPRLGMLGNIVTASRQNCGSNDLAKVRRDVVLLYLFPSPVPRFLNDIWTPEDIAIDTLACSIGGGRCRPNSATEFHRFFCRPPLAYPAIAALPCWSTRNLCTPFFLKTIHCATWPIGKSAENVVSTRQQRTT